MLRKMSNMRAAKARKHEQAIADGWEPEPKMVRAFPLELGVRDTRNGDVAWVPFRSVRDAARRLTMVQKHYA